MDNDSLYLKKLKFDPALLTSWVAAYIGNFRIAILLILAIAVYGIFGYLNLPRQINPDVNIPIVFISAALPGASPNDVEQLVTIPVENAVKSIPDVTAVTSTSIENVSLTSIEFASDVDSDKARDDVQSAVDTVALPDDARDPQVMKLDFEDVPVWQFTLTTEADMATLIGLANEIRNALEDIPTVDRVIVSGSETQEIMIQMKLEAISEFGINPLTISQAVRNAVTAYPGGSVTSDGSSFAVGMDQQAITPDDIRNVRLTIGENTYRLSDFATVSERSAPDQAKTLFLRPGQQVRRAVNVSVYKISGANIDRAARDAKKTVEEHLLPYGDTFGLVPVMDFDKEITESFSDLFVDFASSVTLVFLTLFFFLGIRQAAIASLVIPLSFLFTFGFLHSQGYALSFIAIFSLLLAQGMIVDDVIVIISAMTDYFRTRKFTILQTGLLVWRDYLVPVLTSNLTNIWSFLPLLLATGIIGEFIGIIPTTVIASLIGSTAISILVTIPLMMVVLSPGVPARVITMFKAGLLFAAVAIVIALTAGSYTVVPAVIAFLLVFAVMRLAGPRISAYFASRARHLLPPSRFIARMRQTATHGLFDMKVPTNMYRRLVHRVVTSRRARRLVITGVIIFAVVSYILVPLNLVQNEFFPKSDQDILFVSVELPTGTSIHATTAEAERLIGMIAQTPDIDYVTAQVGARMDMGATGTQSESNVIAFSVNLKPAEDRRRPSFEIAEDMRGRLEGFDRGELFVEEQTEGPPAGADIQIELLGPELSGLDTYADRVIEYLKKEPGLTNAKKSTSPGISKLTFVPDLSKIHDAGLSLDQVGLWLRVYTSGLPIDSIRQEDEDLDITLRTDLAQRTPEALTAILLPLPAPADPVPLISLGTFRLTPNPTRITRQDGYRSITVTASAKPGYNIPELGARLESFADTELSLPAGYSWKTGGINEENQRSVNSILQSMIIAGLLIAGTMVIQLRSFRKAIIVMLVIPLAISGVFYVFAMTGTPLSFPALIGVLALFGIVVKNSILIVDKIDQDLAVGLPFSDAVSDGAAGRLEPILFSSVTNIIGLIPITISDPLWRGLGGAIIAGLTFSGTITLLFIPVVYYTWMKPAESIPKQTAGKKPGRRKTSR